MTEQPTKVAPGVRVTLHARLTLAADGREVESTFGDEPITAVIGDGELAYGLEALLIGLRVGDHKHFEVTASDEVFGPRDSDNIHGIERAEFADDIDLTPGVVIGFTTPGGDEVLGTVLEAGDDEVRVDFNHPLAGHSFTYEVEILALAAPA